MLRKAIQSSISLVPWRWRGVIKKIPLVAPLQRWLLERSLAGREFIHTVDAGPARGLRFPVTLPADKGVWTGSYEREFSTALAAAIQPGDVCLDLGGWRGFFSGVMALAGARRVWTFEPLPDNCAQIRRLMELNPRLPLTLHEAAVGEKAGRLEFVVMPETSMGKLVESTFQKEHGGARKIDVRVVVLDELLERGEIEPPAVIKVDVEGAELFVLRGARRILREHRPKLFMEIHSRDLARESSGLLAGLGYRIHVLETGRAPDFSTEPEVCHFIAIP